MSTAVSLFCADNAFYNPNTPFISHLSTGGIAHLNQIGQSFFVNLYVDTDDRVSTTRTVAWAATTKPSLMVDQAFYAQFITDLSNATDSYRQSIFAIIDRVQFNSSATGSTETFLTTDPTASVAYLAGSFVASSSNVTDTVYSTAVPAGTPYSCPAFSRFSVTIPTGTTTTQYDITCYADNATWIKDYPQSTIMAVVPPLDYTDLLQTNVVTATVNLFAGASAAAILNSTTLIPAFDTAVATAYMEYRATVINSDGTTVVAIFNILYKGAVPSQLAIRAAVKAAVLTSGVGTAAQWQARIPGLFVSSRFYLLPLWDLTLSTTGSLIYSNIVTVGTVISKIETVLSILNQSEVASTLEIFESSYNRIILASVPDSSLTTSVVSLNSLYPSYQCYASTDANFSYMSSDTQSFSQTLAAVLSVATGAVTNSQIYLPIVDRNLTYYSFTEGDVEFCVITQASYLAALNEAA